jgi:CRP-like cAMP-binding protein
VQSQHLVKNRILRQLSADELKSVQPWLTLLELRSNLVLHEPGDPIESVYFPLSGMISLLAVMQSGEAIETGIVGADGLVGGDAAINGHAFGQMTVQLPGVALMMPRARFIDACRAHPHLRNLADRYQAILLVQAQQNGACHALNSVRSRLCRWLLQCQDMIGRDTFGLTQEFLSHMLGVRRNHSFDRRPRPAGSRTDPLQARTNHYPRPRRSRGLCLRMLFGYPRGDRQVNGNG